MKWKDMYKTELVRIYKYIYVSTYKNIEKNIKDKSGEYKEITTFIFSKILESIVNHIDILMYLSLSFLENMKRNNRLENISRENIYNIIKDIISEYDYNKFKNYSNLRDYIEYIIKKSNSINKYATNYINGCKEKYKIENDEDLYYHLYNEIVSDIGILDSRLIDNLVAEGIYKIVSEGGLENGNV